MTNITSSLNKRTHAKQTNNIVMTSLIWGSVYSIGFFGLVLAILYETKPKFIRPKNSSSSIHSIDNKKLILFSILISLPIALIITSLHIFIMHKMNKL